MSDEEIKKFVELFLKMDKILWTEKLWRILNWNIWTINKCYDEEEEKETIIKDTIRYINWDFKYLDKLAEEDEEFKEEFFRKRIKEKEVLDDLKKILNYLIKEE